MVVQILEFADLIADDPFPKVTEGGWRDAAVSQIQLSGLVDVLLGKILVLLCGTLWQHL